MNLISKILFLSLGFNSLSFIVTTAQAGEGGLLSAVPLVRVDSKTYLFQGLTPEGLAALKRARDQVRSRSRLFENELRNLTTIHHAGLVARLFKGNMFLYGPPGGAKSAFVNWLIQGEIEPAYQLQLHEMITEQAFTGGQNFEAAKEGRFELNTQGSLADFAMALIDETEKGNPAALSALLRLLNEREILAGNQVIKARLETLYATSNSNLPELFQKFVESGQSSTAPALLNRFQFKAFVYNWLSISDQALLDGRNQRRRYLKTLAPTHPEVMHDEVFLKPEKVNWAELRELAHVLIQPSPLFMTVYREFIQDLREQTNRAIRESEDRHQQNHLAEPFVYFPSADYTERLRQQIPEIVQMSAFLDFLQSPLADDLELESFTSVDAKPYVLDPLSLWRAYLAMTTLGPGHVKLKVDPQSELKIDLDFDWSIDVNSTRDKREELLVQNLRTEQERFRQTFLKHILSLHEQIELRARNAYSDPDTSVMELSGPSSFELLIQHFQNN
jgi:hypothetical protein